MIEITLENLEATLNLGHACARRLCHNPSIIYLLGDLGAGKTSFAQGFIKELAPKATPTSPTYAYVHSYPGPTPIHHFDLYRASSTQEIESLGLVDVLFDGHAHRLIEWPQVLGTIMRPDLVIELCHTGSMRKATLAGDNKLLALLDIPHNGC